jgi:hypothetical protein
VVPQGTFSFVLCWIFLCLAASLTLVYTSRKTRVWLTCTCTTLTRAHTHTEGSIESGHHSDMKLTHMHCEMHRIWCLAIFTLPCLCLLISCVLVLCLVLGSNLVLPSSSVSHACSVLDHFPSLCTYLTENTCLSYKTYCFEVIHCAEYIMTIKDQYTSVEHNCIFFE